MNKLFISICILCCGFTVKAQYPGYTSLNDLGTFKSAFAVAAQKTSSIKSDFVQEKNLSMLSEKIISKGKFWFKKENQVRMEYTNPFEYLMVINKDKVFIKDGQKQNTISTKSNKLFQQINKITVDCVQGNVLNNTDFTIRVFENKTTYLIEMSPMAKNLKDFFKTIIVTVDKKDYTVSNIEMDENSGDNTIIRFSNKEMNTNLPDALFAIK
ncbi:MAG: outer membrane lipoprotein carrier protein LolA [Bacteroidetes bacterium]|jgi:outer membrane lipoprotein-sorting protein|nr:outer membrane lipoprotein carrier protein LolA [Bacteroidota bacterium]